MVLAQGNMVSTKYVSHKKKRLMMIFGESVINAVESVWIFLTFAFDDRRLMPIFSVLDVE